MRSIHYPFPPCIVHGGIFYFDNDNLAQYPSYHLQKFKREGCRSFPLPAFRVLLSFGIFFLWFLRCVP